MGLIKELREVKKYMPQITSAFERFDHGEDPKKALEEIINIAEDYPALDEFLKFNETRGLILRGQERAEKEAKKRGWNYGWNYACKEALKEIGVNYEIRGGKNIPKDGGVLYVSNHPYGLLDSIILLGGLGSLVSKEKRKLKVIGMNQLRFIKGLEEVVYFVHSTVKGPNFSIRRSLRYLDKGGDLAIYPSGRMSKLGLREYPWKENLETFISHSKYVVPMWFSGPDHSKIYNFLAFFKEKLRRAFSLGEVWDKEGETVILNIGDPIKSEDLELIENPEEMVQHLRDITECLKVAV